ncbi:MAG: hypothetical protein ATN34_01565 [Epulopiscium sp. Nele67-Bin002]|nr:MAG: hypothetical protein BEN18_06760 [Epulopiscium sp. Nuni2H_MBin001]OON90250.1 MAG: hypothetical protein ATN33_03435 [Epulopiscium sp. Nele67-Bin001]OON92325.1 MAG: hypothetical protein ATN34_01565 [Epulopiscium sp. Nele67-Bin002]
MKKFTKLIGLFSVMLLAAGCSNGGEVSAEANNASTVLRVQWIGDFQQQDSTDPITGTRRIGLHVIEEEFERLYPEVDVQFITMGWDDYVKKTQTMIISNEADVYQVPGISGLVDQNMLLSLEPYIERDNYDLSVYLDGQVEGWMVAGPDDDELKIYSLPLLGDTRFITYDKLIFDQWGVEYLSENPTIDEIKDKASQMTGINPVTGEYNYGLTYAGVDAADSIMNINESLGGIWGTGVRLSELETEFNSATMIEAANIFLDLAQYAPETALVDQGSELYGTANNNIAINFRDASKTIFSSIELGLGDRYGVSKLFINEDFSMGGMFAGSPLAISTTSENPDLAWEYIKFTSSDFVQQFLWENYNNQTLPVTTAGLTFEGIADNAEVYKMVESMEQLWTPRYIYRASQPRYILTDAVENIILGTMSIEDALNKAQKETEDWVAQQ